MRHCSAMQKAVGCNFFPPRLRVLVHSSTKVVVFQRNENKQYILTSGKLFKNKCEYEQKKRSSSTEQ